MQIKSFRAPTIADAVNQVKKELGPDAIILGNKKISISPTESVVEVMAAIEPEPVTGNEESEFQRDIQEIKSFLSMLISSKDYFTQLQVQQPLAEIYHSLIIRGLDEKHTYLLLNKALSPIDEGSSAKRQIIECFCRQLIDIIKFAKPFSQLSKVEDAPSVFTFLGPTGVGKTTTLAKLAAYLKVKRKIKLGIISVDTYRIGAADQLLTYANILNVPLRLAMNRNEFQAAREHFQQQDVILVDTIGRNFLQRQHVETMHEIFAGTENIRHLLVLSATAKDVDLQRTINHFHPLDLHSLIFTKVDETTIHGCIINQLLRFPYPLSYLGTGQRVPEDIELATHKRLLALLFPAGNGSTRKDFHGSGSGAE
jgi:flagellar biosynthesis protein FlhF